MHIRALMNRRPVVTDTAIYQDACFVEAQKALGILSPADHRRYMAAYQKIGEKIPTPDLVVYLRASPNELERRIRARSRTMETAVPRPYLAALVRAQEQWVRAHARRIPILTIRTAGLNFAEDEKARRLLIRKIQGALKKKGFR